MGLAIRGSNSGLGEIFSSEQRPHRLWCSTSFLLSAYRYSFRVWSDRGETLTTHLHVAARLGMSGAIPLLLLYAFLTWRKTLHFSLFLEGCQVYFTKLKMVTKLCFFVCVFQVSKLLPCCSWKLDSDLDKTLGRWVGACLGKLFNTKHRGTMEGDPTRRKF